MRRRLLPCAVGVPPRIVSNSLSAISPAMARPWSSVSMPPGLQIDAELGAVAPAGVFDARDLSVRLKADQPRADIDRGKIDHLAVGADRDLRGAAADVDIHHHAFVADRARRRARAVGRHHGFQAVAGADGDELAGLLGEQFADGAGVLPLHRDAGQDQRAGVDLVGIDLGVGVFLLDEGAERLGVDGVLGGVGRQQDVGGVERLALGDDIAAVEPLQHDPREHQMRGRRADVDADAEHDDLVLALERAPGRGKENAAALVFVVHRRLLLACIDKAGMRPS